MKIVQTCDEKPPAKKHVSSVSVGAVFSFGSSDVQHKYLRLGSGQTVCLTTNLLYPDSAFGADLPNYKEYPNARVVLE